MSGSDQLEVEMWTPQSFGKPSTTKTDEFTITTKLSWHGPPFGNARILKAPANARRPLYSIHFANLIN